MIAFSLLASMALAGASAAPVERASHAYMTCLRGTQKTSLAAKMAPAAFGTQIKTACPNEAAALTQALVAFDLAMGTARAKAQANAARDVANYVEEVEASYADSFQQ